MYKPIYLSPMIPSFNLGLTANFFINVLGFTTVLNYDSYKILVKDHISVHLLSAGENIGQMEFYLEVDNADVLWNSIKDKVIGLKVKPPFDQDYGMREIHIGIPETNTLMFIGSSIVKSS